MRHIDKDQLHGSGASMMTSGLKTTARNRHGEPVKRKTLCLPKDIHYLMSEICFREEITLKRLVVNAITEVLSCGIAECGNYNFSQTKHPAIDFPYGIAKGIRTMAHEKRIPERTLITESVNQYIRHYKDKYPDLNI